MRVFIIVNIGESHIDDILNHILTLFCWECREAGKSVKRPSLM